MSFSFCCLCIIVVYVHISESRVLILREYDDEPLILDHKDSQEEISVKPLQPVLTVLTPKRIRASKKTILQFGRQIYHLDDYDRIELKSAFKPESISYDYVDIGELMRSSIAAKNGVKDLLNHLFILTPQMICYGHQCEIDLRKHNEKRKNNDNADWKQKKKQFPLGHMKRFQIVDNIHNSVRNPKIGSEEFHGKTESSKKKKKMYSSESKESGSAEANSETSKEKEESKNTEENKNENDSDADSSGKLTSDEYIPKKKPKKKNFETDKTKRKTITLEDTYFMQGNKIFHSTGRNKKRHYDDGRRRLEHFMPKRYHWDPSEINDLGYYWFNGPKGMYPEPKVLST